MKPAVAIALTGGGITDPRLADAFAAEALGVSLEQLQRTPESHIRYALEIRRQRAEIRRMELEAAARMRGGG